MAFNWTCPTCGRHTSITGPNIVHTKQAVICGATKRDMGIQLSSTLIECPNQECHAQSFKVSVHYCVFARNSDGCPRNMNADNDRPVGVGKFTFSPATAEPLSKYVPANVLEDYNEAYLISSLSPKASATLSRRALQGMVRDFFKVRKRTLHMEIVAIEHRCNPALFKAMMGLKSIGNIGAHPEHDTSLIVEVEPDEPSALLKLIHLLDREWYVARADSEARIANVMGIDARTKTAQLGAPKAINAVLQLSAPTIVVQGGMPTNLLTD